MKRIKLYYLVLRYKIENIINLILLRKDNKQHIRLVSYILQNENIKKCQICGKRKVCKIVNVDKNRKEYWCRECREEEENAFIK